MHPRHRWHGNHFATGKLYTRLFLFLFPSQPSFTTACQTSARTVQTQNPRLKSRHFPLASGCIFQHRAYHFLAAYGDGMIMLLLCYCDAGYPRTCHAFFSAMDCGQMLRITTTASISFLHNSTAE